MFVFFPFSCLDPKVELCPRSFRSGRVKITTPLLGNAPVHFLFANILKLLWLQPLLLHSTYIHRCILFHKEHKIHLIHNEVNLSILMLQHIFKPDHIFFFLVQKMPMIQSGQVLLWFLP